MRVHSWLPKRRGWPARLSYCPCGRRPRSVGGLSLRSCARSFLGTWILARTLIRSVGTCRYVDLVRSTAGSLPSWSNSIAEGLTIVAWAHVPVFLLAYVAGSAGGGAARRSQKPQSVSSTWFLSTWRFTPGVMPSEGCGETGGLYSSPLQSSFGWSPRRLCICARPCSSGSLLQGHTLALGLNWSSSGSSNSRSWSTRSPSTSSAASHRRQWPFRPLLYSRSAAPRSRMC